VAFLDSWRLLRQRGNGRRPFLSCRQIKISLRIRSYIKNALESLAASKGRLYFLKDHVFTYFCLKCLGELFTRGRNETPVSITPTLDGTEGASGTCGT
jgi:hypothetical protein